MLRGLQIGFGERVDPVILDQVAALGVQVARVKVGRDRAETAAIVHQITDRGMRPLVIIDRPGQVFWLPQDVALDVELMNEPDIGTDNQGRGVSPLEYRLAVADAHGAVWSRRQEGQDLRLWVGSVSNFTQRGLRWLEDIMPAVPGNTGISIHWYPHGSLSGPHPGFSCREAEMLAFLDRIEDQPWALTETGWHTAPQPRGWFRRPVQWTDEQVAAAAEVEFGRWEWMGASIAVLYQVTDGLTEAAGDRYGIRRLDGTLKPVARVFASNLNWKGDRPR